MIDISEYYSNSKYISLIPFKEKRYFLAASSIVEFKNSIQLFCPFSRKGKYLKQAIIASNLIIPFVSCPKSEGKQIRKIKNILVSNKLPIGNLTSSIYLSTDGDKLIIQIQTIKDGIIAYLKIARNHRGNKRLKNEIKASKVFRARGIDSINLIDSGTIDEKNIWFLSLPKRMQQKQVSIKKLTKILNLLYTNTSFLLKDHPRVHQLYKLLKELKEYEILTFLDSIVKHDKQKFHIVHEHGDLAPWNIFISDDKLHLFDLEFYEENGLEYFDFIYFWFSQEIFLNNKNEREIINGLLNKLNLKKGKTILALFFIKEITKKRGYRLCLKGLLKTLMN